MPELPEVETVRRELAPLIEGRRVVAVRAWPTDKFASAAEAVGRRIGPLGRRGKYLIAPLSGHRELVIHLGMTGVLQVGPQSGHPHVRAAWDLAGVKSRRLAPATLELRDTRMFGRAVVVATGDYQALPTLARLGPDAFDDAFTARHLATALARSSAPVKAILLGQKAVAGTGNIYADEALWAARIHPEARHVGGRAATRLHAALRAVMGQGLAMGGTTLRDYRTPSGAEGENQHHLQCYGRAGLPCLRCGYVLGKMAVAGRTSTFCPRCQPR